MKYLVILAVTLATLTASAQSGVDAIAKQRARDAANQGANRSIDLPGNMPPPGGRPAAPAPAPAVAATPLTPGQQAFAIFQAELLAVKTNSTDVQSALGRGMANVAQGANKPSSATLSKLSDHLATALTDTKLTPARKTRLAQDIGVLLNSANTPPAQKDALIKDAQSILSAGGASADAAAAVAGDLKTVTDEVKPAAK